MGCEDEADGPQGLAGDERATSVNPNPVMSHSSLPLLSQFQKTHSDDPKREGRADTLHAGAYMGYYPDNGIGTGWYDDQGRVACPFPATPKDNHDGVPKPSGIRRKVR